MSRFWSFMLAVSLAALSLAGCGGSPQKETAAPAGSGAPAKSESAQAPIKLVFAHSANPDNALAMGYNKFAELVKEKSKGRLIVEVHGSGTLAADAKAVEGVKLGTIDIASNASNNMAGFTKAFLFGDLPYIFESVEKSRKIWDGPIGDEIKAQVEKDMNMKVLMYMDTGGFRQIGSTKKPIKTPADLQGIKLRATASPVEIALLKEWGANPTPIAWPEVYTALQQGVVEGEHLHYIWMLDAKHQEVLKYITEINSMMNIHVALISKSKFDSLPKDLQQVLLEAAKEAEVYNRKVDLEKQAEARAAIERSGVKIYTPTPGELKQWKTVASKVWESQKANVPPEYVKRIIDAQK